MVRWSSTAIGPARPGTREAALRPLPEDRDQPPLRRLRRAQLRQAARLGRVPPRRPVEPRRSHGCEERHLALPTPPPDGRPPAELRHATAPRWEGPVQQADVGLAQSQLSQIPVAGRAIWQVGQILTTGSTFAVRFGAAARVRVGVTGCSSATTSKPRSTSTFAAPSSAPVSSSRLAGRPSPAGRPRRRSPSRRTPRRGATACGCGPHGLRSGRGSRGTEPVTLCDGGQDVRAVHQVPVRHFPNVRHRALVLRGGRRPPAGRFQVPTRLIPRE